MSRGAVFAFASSITIAGCGSSVESPAPSDAAVDTATTDTGQPAPLYGLPPDTGVDDMGTIDAAYGAPADTGGGGALYGAAPDK